MIKFIPKTNLTRYAIWLEITGYRKGPTQLSQCKVRTDILEAFYVIFLFVISADVEVYKN